MRTRAKLKTYHSDELGQVTVPEPEITAEQYEATAEHHRKMAHHFYTHNLESQRDAALEAAARADAEAARLRAEGAEDPTADDHTGPRGGEAYAEMQESQAQIQRELKR